MAVGDDAASVSYQLVPNTGEDGRVRWGAREINRTRDYLAVLLKSIPAVWPIARGGTGGTTPAEARAGLELMGRMSMGTGDPSGGAHGDIYFKYTP